jgi:cyclic lactone autoinducer peptide
MEKTLRAIFTLISKIATLTATTSVSLASPPYSAYQPKAPKSLIKAD